MDKKRILYIGSLYDGQTSLERMKAMQDLGHNIIGINAIRPIHKILRIVNRFLQIFGIYPDLTGLNNDIRKVISSHVFDIVWVDKGTQVKPSTLWFIKKKQPYCRLVHLNPDDPFGKFRRGWALFLRGLPLYDVHFVARVPNVEEYQTSGGNNVHVYDRSFSKNLHRPLTQVEAGRTPVGFIGSCAPERAAAIAYLINNGIPVAVYGDGWINSHYWADIKPCFQDTARIAEEYVKTINNMDIALHFLRRENRDEQDSRTFEIPACGTFMIAERTSKHKEFFIEDEEAVFFDTPEELLDKVRYYISHPLEAKRIGAAGRQRSISSGYDHHSRIRNLLEIALR